MFTAQILSTNMFTLDAELENDPIPFSELVAISERMFESQYLRFQLLENHQPLFELSFLKYDPSSTLLSAIKDHLKKLVKEKKVTRKEGKRIEKELLLSTERQGAEQVSLDGQIIETINGDNSEQPVIGETLEENVPTRVKENEVNVSTKRPQSSPKRLAVCFLIISLTGVSIKS